MCIPRVNLYFICVLLPQNKSLHNELAKKDRQLKTVETKVKDFVLMPTLTFLCISVYLIECLKLWIQDSPQHLQPINLFEIILSVTPRSFSVVLL